MNTPSRPAAGGSGSPANSSLRVPRIYAAANPRVTPRNPGSSRGGLSSVVPGETSRSARVSQPLNRRRPSPRDSTDAAAAQHAAAARSLVSWPGDFTTSTRVPFRVMSPQRRRVPGAAGDPQQGTPLWSSQRRSQVSEARTSRSPGSRVSRRIALSIPGGSEPRSRTRPPLRSPGEDTPGPAGRPAVADSDVVEYICVYFFPFFPEIRPAQNDETTK
jgi:hypothetical protein